MKKLVYLAILSFVGAAYSSAGCTVENLGKGIKRYRSSGGAVLLTDNPSGKTTIEWIKENCR